MIVLVHERLTCQGELGVFEVRNIEGYGLRWSQNGHTFRGFLEPQMENGHEVGWVH